MGVLPAPSKFLHPSAGAPCELPTSSWAETPRCCAGGAPRGLLETVAVGALLRQGVERKLEQKANAFATALLVCSIA